MLLHWTRSAKQLILEGWFISKGRVKSQMSYATGLFKIHIYYQSVLLLVIRIC